MTNNDWAAKAAEQISLQFLLQLGHVNREKAETQIAAIISEHYEAATKYYVCTCWPAWNKECAVHGGKR